MYWTLGYMISIYFFFIVCKLSIQKTLLQWVSLQTVYLDQKVSKKYNFSKLLYEH